ncbi:sugar ABC transporter substrate-binding protein [Streptosporangium sp. V21-05]|uniref:sugar ABC transporter substrate-binding protein n=1 Tax=Streptosporangium sp. V21-05 TaxID=3446115 RepID=UPI003F52BC3A
MKAVNNQRKGLFADLLISLASGTILALGAKALTMVMPGLNGSPMTWVFIAITPTTALLAFFFARRLYGGANQAFITMSAFTQTRWLGDVLEHLSRSLDRHGIDLVVKLPPHDHSGRNQLAYLASLRKRRRSYIGGFVILAQTRQAGRELAASCEAVKRPVVFIDVPPFPDLGEYPARTAFVGCDANEMGAKAAQWVAKDLIDRGVENPAVLVVTGDAQDGRHTTFAERIEEMLPSAKLEINLLGFFSREEARKVVGHHLRRLRPGNGMDAIFCTNDEMALGAADAVQEHLAAGNRLDELVIIGVDGIAEAVAAINVDTAPFRATIIQDPRHIAEVAVDALLKMRSGERVPTEILVPTTVYPKQ